MNGWVWVVLGVARLVAVAGVCCVVFVGVRVASVWAAGSIAPAWSVDVLAVASNFSTAQNTGCEEAVREEALTAAKYCDAFTSTVTNAGAKATTGGTVTIVDRLPEDVSVGLVALQWSQGSQEDKELGKFCGVAGVPQVVTCVVPHGFFEGGGAGERAVEPDDTLKLFVFVTVTGSPGAPVTNTVSVEGAGAARVQASASSTIGMAEAGFGLEGFSAPLLGLEGAPDLQAGGHPYEWPVKIDLNTVFREDPEGSVRPTSAQDVRDVLVDLPVGVAGAIAGVPQCTLAQLATLIAGSVSSCPLDTVVGHLRTFPESLAGADFDIYNVVPERGAAAEFGFVDVAGGVHVLTAGLAPTPEGYVLRSSGREITAIQLSEITANAYGDPAARERSSEKSVAYSTRPEDPQLFTNPEDCTGQPLAARIYTDSWQNPARFNTDGTPSDLGEAAWVKQESLSPAVAGCSELAGLFDPRFAAAPETARADSPTGLGVAVKLPQAESSETPATPPLKTTVVTLPEGLDINPSSVNGLQACSEAQIGWLGGTVSNFTPSEPTCPKASRIGSVELETPALPNKACRQHEKALSECPEESEQENIQPLEGSIYVAEPYENPFSEPGHPAGSLIALYIVIDDPRTGVIVKIPVEVKANPATGQLTSEVPDTPQFPFSELRTHFFGGNTASLSTPAECGGYAISSSLTPWSAPEPVTQSSAFEISQDASGGGCPPAPPFAPTLTAGTSNALASAFSSLSTTFSRADTQQNFAGVNVTMPPGLAALIKNVPQCPEPQAAQGDCAPESEIGEATSAVGTGPDPYWVHGGKVYLTGPYENASFGLTVVVPTTAGPYTLTGNGGYGKEIVRASIHVNQSTGQASVQSSQLPTIIQGIPLAIKTVNVTITHPGFVINPSNCETLAIEASFTSTHNTTATTTTPFHTANCALLPFQAKLTATAAAQASKPNGVAFSVKITSPGLGQANIHKVELTIPAVLPSRLETIQKACPDATFAANPASCPAGSIIGEGIVHTPILANPLRGPAYLVSHAAAAFPDIELVLQGEHVTIVLDGKTDIKNKVTYSKFETAPDEPFTTFESVFPAGPHSALTAHVPEHERYNLCRQPPIKMPTQLIAQNNAEINQTTIIELQGCPKTISIISHHTNTHSHTLTLTIYTPTAGKLKITSNHTHTTATSHTREPITIKLHLTHHNQHTKLKLQLTFTPQTGPKQTTHTTITT